MNKDPCHMHRKSTKAMMLASLFCSLIFFGSTIESAQLSEQLTPITAIALTPNGHWLSGSDDGLQLHDPVTLQPVKRIESGLEKIYSIKLSPDQTKVVIAGGTPAEIGVVEVLSVSTWEKTHEFGPFDDIATDCVWLANDQLIAGSMTGDCCEISLPQQTPAPFNVHSKGILSIAKLNSKIVVTGGLDHTIGVWDLEKQAMLRVLNNHVDVVNQLAIQPTNQQNEGGRQAMIVTVSDDATVRFWQPAIGRMVRFARLESIPTCVIWNHEGTQAIVGTQSGKIFFVDSASAKTVQSIDGTGWINCLALPVAETSIIVGGAAGLERMSITAN